MSKTCTMSKRSVERMENLLCSLEKSATISYLFLDYIQDLLSVDSVNDEAFQGKTDRGESLDLYMVVEALRDELDNVVHYHHELHTVNCEMFDECREYRQYVQSGYDLALLPEWAK